MRAAETAQEAQSQAQDVPRSVAGTVTEAGDIVNQDNQTIGKIAEEKDPKELAGNTVNEAGEVVSEAGDVLGKATIGDAEAGENASEYTTDAQDDAKSSGSGWFSKTKGAFNAVGSGIGSLSGRSNAGDTPDTAKDAAGEATQAAQDTKEQAEGAAEDAKDTAQDATEQAQDKAEGTAEDAQNKAEGTTEDAQDKADGATDEAQDKAEGATDEAKDQAEGTAEDAQDKAEGATEDAQDKAEGTAEEAQDQAEGAAEDAENKLDFSILQNSTVNKAGNLVNEEGKVVGRLTEGEAKKIQGKKSDENGDIWNDSGKKVGRAEPLPEDELESSNKEAAPFENFPDAVVEGDGKITSDGKQIGTVVEGDPKQLKGSKVDEDGDILDRNGNTVGRAEAWNEPEAEEEPEEDRSAFAILDGTTVNKAGNLVNENGKVVGRLLEGEAKQLQGKKSDGNGDIWNDSGKKVGRAEPIPEEERDSSNKESAPFENFPDAVVEADGKVTSEGKQIGTVVEGDPKKLKGSKVDEDGDILDRNGNTIGRAEPWDEPEPEEEQEVDNSALAGKRVNKAGNVVDSNGSIFGRVIEGNAASMVGRMCDKNGNILSESGDILGKAELVSEGEREGLKEGPFAELDGLTVSKDGKVVTASGDVVGRLTSGDGKQLFGRKVDADGDVVDGNGNVLAKAERWEEPEEEKKKGPMAGLKVNRDGNVVNDDGTTVGQLTSGDLQICAGKEVDDDGDVVNSKGNTVGHVTLLEDIPQESEEDKKTREQAEKDRELAKQMGGAIEQSLDKIKPILRMIKDKINTAEQTPKDELDEEALVREVKPLIEEGGKILTETNGQIRGMDPDGRIQRNAKHKSGTKEASPEEHHLAEMLKELTSGVQETIDDAKNKIEGMPHAKEELNPLWGLLTEPLGQILAAVGLLLSGVLGLVGRLVSFFHDERSRFRK